MIEGVEKNIINYLMSRCHQLIDSIREEKAVSAVAKSLWEMPQHVRILCHDKENNQPIVWDTLSFPTRYKQKVVAGIRCSKMSSLKVTRG